MSSFVRKKSVNEYYGDDVAIVAVMLNYKLEEHSEWVVVVA